MSQLLAQIALEPANILTGVSLGLSAWVLRGMVQLKQDVAVLATKLDLAIRCNDCANYTPARELRNKSGTAHAR